MGPTVTGRVAALLGAFGTEHSAMTLSELSRRTGLPLTTVHRLTGELTRHGLLERDDEQRFRIGLRLWEIASTASRAVDLRDAALPVLQDLYSATRENVQFAVLDGAEAVYLERLSGPESVHVVNRVGSRLPVHATGVGLVLLAHAPVEVQDEVLAAPLIRFTRHTVTDPGGCGGCSRTSGSRDTRSAIGRSSRSRCRSRRRCATGRDGWWPQSPSSSR